MKKYIGKVIIATIAVAIVVIGIFVLRNKFVFKKLDGVVDCNFKVQGKNILIKNSGDYDNLLLKGVSMGNSKPGSFPNEFAITKEEYLKWFKEIYDMNANIIRVYTIQSPEFYDALKEFNKGKDNPLYIMQGLGIDDIKAQEKMNAFDNDFYKDTKKSVEDLVDIIHGKGRIGADNIFKEGRYKADISEYVLGYIIGIEWEPVFVHETNLFNEDKNSYSGEYLSVKNGAAFEVFLAEMGEHAIKYETSKYEEQRLIGFANWPPTDLLANREADKPHDNIVNIDTRNIVSNEKLLSGLFAPYNIYPNYPNILNTEERLSGSIDEEGNINPYRAYLKEVNNHHNIPVVVTEFGVPSSRGISDIDEVRGFNKGNIDEVKQGEITIQLYNDIVKAGLAGGCAFSWQDEWFKQSWNTRNRVNIDSGAMWGNPQNNEANYGILAFDPGDKVTCYPDNSLEEWKDATETYSNELGKLYMKSDSKYLYFNAEMKNVDFSNESIYIPIDITPESGSKEASDFGLTFDSQVDFVIEINEGNESRIYVQNDYDFVNRLENDVNDQFNKIYQPIKEEVYINDNFIEVPLEDKFFETGKLTKGNSNPNSEEYNSLVDYSIIENNIEIRIPWQLLNFTDPATGKVAGYYSNGEFSEISIEEIKVGIGKTNSNIKMGEYKLQKWDAPKYSERLKPVYYSLQKAYKEGN